MQTSSTVQRRRLGLLLQQLRAEKGLTTRQAGAAVGRNETWISRVESARNGIDVAHLRALMDLYEVTDLEARAEMEDLSRGGRQRGWWSRYRSTISSDYAAYIGFEAGASRLLIWQSLVVDGLLQTEDYMRLLFEAGSPGDVERVERLVRVRLQRQQRLTASPPLELSVVLDEAVLRRVIGGDREVHVRQLDHLLDVARTVPKVCVQVVPFDEAFHPGMLPAFTVLQFANDPPIGYIEGPTSDLYEEGANADRITLIHEDLRAAALSSTRTIALIRRVRDEVAAT